MGRHVLLIEDEPNIIEAISFLILRHGWKVDAHSDGGSALRFVAEHSPDAIILDVMLPNKSGFEILRALKSNPETQNVPVLMLTARGQSKDRQMAAEYGADYYMTKPFSNAEVLQKLQEMMNDKDSA